MKNWLAVKEKSSGIFFVQHRDVREKLLEILQQTGLSPKTIVEKTFDNENAACDWTVRMNGLNHLINEILKDGV